MAWKWGTRRRWYYRTLASAKSTSTGLVALSLERALTPTGAGLVGCIRAGLGRKGELWRQVCPRGLARQIGSVHTQRLLSTN